MSTKSRSTVQLTEVLTRLAEQRVLWEPLIKFRSHLATLCPTRGRARL
jgi:hypothetical protein